MSISKDLTDLAVARMSEAVLSVLQLTDEPALRTRIVVFCLTRMLSIAGHTIQEDMQKAGKEPGTDVECARGAVENILRRIEHAREVRVLQ